MEALSISESRAMLQRLIDDLTERGIEILDAPRADQEQYEGCHEIILNKRGEKIYIREDN